MANADYLVWLTLSAVRCPINTKGIIITNHLQVVPEGITDTPVIGIPLRFCHFSVLD